VHGRERVIHAHVAQVRVHQAKADRYGAVEIFQLGEPSYGIGVADLLACDRGVSVSSDGEVSTTILAERASASKTGTAVVWESNSPTRRWSDGRLGETSA